jgi:adenylate cyclase
MAGETQRRLTTIVAADIAGFSQLVGIDEEGTLAAQRSHRAELIEPLLAEHHGRIANTAGDSFLFEFSSAVEAVRFAIAVQKGMAEENQGVPNERRIEYRIGINVGDVIADGDDLLGDGVNVAARLEGLAESGGICISRTARDQVRDRMELPLDDMGAISVKNISRAVRVFKINFDNTTSSALSKTPIAMSKAKQQHLYIAAALIVAFVAGAILWQQPWVPRANNITHFSDEILAVPTGPSVAVMPFSNLSAKGFYDALPDGLAHEISNGLTKFTAIRTVGRSSTSRYKGKKLDPILAGKDLHVAYLLHATVQVDANNVRVFSELLKTSDGTQVWSEAYDGDLSGKNLFAFQEEIAQNVVTAIAEGHGIISQVEREKLRGKPIENLGAYECSLLSHVLMETGGTPESHKNARDCWERVVAETPDTAEGWGWLAIIYAFESSNQLNPRPNSMERSLEAGERAVNLDRDNQIAWMGLARAHFTRGEQDEFTASAEKTLSLNPNNVMIVALVAFMLDHNDQYELSKPLFEKAIKLNPFPPFWYFLPFYEEAYRNQEYKKALEFTLRHDPPKFIWTHIRRAQVYAKLGDKKKASENVEEILGQRPDFAKTIRSELKAWDVKEEEIKVFLNDLREAGMQIPDEGS